MASIKTRFRCQIASKLGDDPVTGAHMVSVTLTPSYFSDAGSDGNAVIENRKVFGKGGPVGNIVMTLVGAEAVELLQAEREFFVTFEAAD